MTGLRVGERATENVAPEIAGIQWQEIGFEAHPEHDNYLAEQPGGFLHAHARARRLYREGVGTDQGRGEYDPRVVRFDVRGQTSPRFRFLGDETLLRAVQELRREAGGGVPPQNHLLAAALSNTDGAVRPDFAADAINDINASYFRSAMAFSSEAGLARFFTHFPSVSLSLGALIGEQFDRPGGELRIKELCSGQLVEQWLDRTAGILACGVGRVALTLSDIMPPPVADLPARPYLERRAETYSLFDSMPELPHRQRYDAMVATYGFDSVWLPGDVRVWRHGDQWYQALYRIKVADWHARRDELLHALRTGQALSRAVPADYEGIFVEEAWRRIDTPKLPYAEFLPETEHRSCNIPGGLIRRVAEAFERQLRPDGVFVIADICEYDEADCQGQLACDVSGVAERYKVEEYTIAARALQKAYGLEVEVRSMADVVWDYIEDWSDLFPGEKQALAESTTTHVMVVRRRSR